MAAVLGARAEPARVVATSAELGLLRSAVRQFRGYCLDTGLSRLLTLVAASADDAKGGPDDQECSHYCNDH